MLGFTLFSPTCGWHRYRPVYNFFMPMPANSRHACLLSAGVLLCLLVPGGCGQAPDNAADTQHLHKPVPLPEPAAAMPPDPAPALVSAKAAARSTLPADAPGEDPGPESLLLTPQEKPFTDQAARNFGEVPDADWLAAQPQRPARRRLLPDLFDNPGDQDKVNFEGELMLDDSQEISRMVDGIGVKIEIKTDE